MRLSAQGILGVRKVEGDRLTMNVLHILASGGTGGIETLCRDFDRHSVHDNTYIFVRGRNGNT